MENDTTTDIAVKDFTADTSKDFTSKANKLGADQDLVNLYNAGVFNKDTPTVPDTTTEPTISNFGAPSNDNAYDTAVNQYYQDTQNVDENKIRSNVLKQFQGEINATKNSYGQLLNEVKLQGKGRLGEDTAIQARRGLLGSDFGAAQTDKTRAYNVSENDRVLQSQAAAIAAINARAMGFAQNEITANRLAKSQGAEAMLANLKSKPERVAKELENLANAFLLQNKDPMSLDKTELENIAKGYGVTTNDIINAYLGRKETKEKEDEKDLKEKYQTVGSGSALVNPETGEIIYQSEKSNTLTPYQQFSATQSIAKDTQARTENAREMSRQAQLIKNSYANISKGGDRSLNTQAMVTSFNKILDPTSVVRESEYDRTAAGQSLIAQLEGKVQQIATGGAGITDATLKEAADIADQYLKESQASVLQENERARSMAGQFGLNPDFVTTGGYTQTSPDDVSWEDL
jgi:hypothetical protein